MIHRPGTTEFISIVLKIRHSIQGSKHDSYSKIYFTASENTKTHQVYAKVSEYQPWLLIYNRPLTSLYKEVHEQANDNV